MSAPPSTGSPKHMVHGPCGGVTPTGGCEVDPLPCPFVDRDLPHPPAPPDPPRRSVASPLDGVLGASPVVVADLPAAALDRGSLRRCARLLSGSVDAVLVGDHAGERVQFPPALRAAWVQEAGVAPWVGLNCRDRNRVALEAELAALAEIGPAGVHCVTGDHPALGHRPDAAAVFDLDSTRLVRLAAEAGLLASVAENPVAPPVALRPARLAAKVAAGARAAFVNHTDGPPRVAAFAAAVRAAGTRVPLIACVPVVVDEESAGLLRSFTGLALPPGYVEGILRAPDPHRAGVAAAVDLSLRLLGVPGVLGIDLSGGAGSTPPETVAAAMAEIAQGVVASLTGDLPAVPAPARGPVVGTPAEALTVTSPEALTVTSPEALAVTSAEALTGAHPGGQR